MKQTLCLLTLVGTLAFSQQALAQDALQPAPPPEEPKPTWMEYKDPYVNQQDMRSPHRSHAEIQQWSQETVTDILHLTPGNYEAQLRKLKGVFEKESWMVYAKFLKETGYLETVTKQGLSTEAIVRGAPEIVTNKAVGEAYHWVVKLPVTISTFALVNDTDKQTQDSASYIVFIDFKRDEHAKNTMEVVISDIRFDKDITSQP